MLTTTKNVLDAALRADPTLSAEARRGALAAAVSRAEAGNDGPPIVLRPREAARLLSVTPRTLLNLCQRGALNPVRLPGNRRALGYRRDEIERLAEIGR